MLKFSEVTLEDGKKVLGFEKDKNMTGEEFMNLQDKTLCASSGAASSVFGLHMFNQVLNAMSLIGRDKVQHATAVNAELIALNPKDVIEGALIGRLMLLHDCYMTLLHKNNSERDELDDCFFAEEILPKVSELMRLYNESLKALCDYRITKKECGA